MAADDPYVALGVAPSASRESIRAAYRSLARRHHPDRGGDAARMASLNAAWDILKDPARRAAFDAMRGSSPEPPIPAPPFWAPAARPAAPGSGTILDFGRYEGWSLARVAEADPDYLEWLVRAPIGRPLKPEIDAMLAARAAALEGLRPPQPPPARRWRR